MCLGRVVYEYGAFLWAIHADGSAVGYVGGLFVETLRDRDCWNLPHTSFVTD